MKRLTTRVFFRLHSDSLTYLIENGLDLAIANWAHRVVANSIWKRFKFIFYASILLVLPPMVPNFIIQDGRTSKALALVSGVGLICIISYMIVEAEEKRSNPRPESVLHEILKAANSLADISDLNGTCASGVEGWDWKDRYNTSTYVGKHNVITSFRSFVQPIAWSLSQQVARVAGHTRRERGSSQSRV